MSTMHSSLPLQRRPRPASFQCPRSPMQLRSRLQHLPASILLLVATALAPPVLKHTFRPPGYRSAQRSLLAAALTCHALRCVCFPLAAQVLRSPRLRPQYVADLGESVRELEAKLDFVLERESLWGIVRKLDIEIYARASQCLASKLVKLFTILPHLTFISLKLPTYHVFRDGLIADLRLAMHKEQQDKVGSARRRIRELCIDTRLSWMLEHFPGVRELVVWSWPSEVDREGGLTVDETTDGWRTFLAGLNVQAPCVREVEVGGLSVYDVNELFPSLANNLSRVTTLRILHRKEEHGSIPLNDPAALQIIPPNTAAAICGLWEDTRDDGEYEGQLISGRAGGVKRIVYFDLQEECGSCYVPSSSGKGNGFWVDEGPALVLSSKCMRGGV